MRQYFIDYYCEDNQEWVTECTVTARNKKAAEEMAAKSMYGCRFRVRCVE